MPVTRRVCGAPQRYSECMGARRTWMIPLAGAVVALTLAGCHSAPSAGASPAADAAVVPAGALEAVAEVTAPAQAASTDPGPVVPSDPAQASVAGDLALQSGDCRTAADDLAAATVGGTAQMGSHATEVALDCENIPAAWIAAQNWLKAAPKDSQAALSYATIALKLYRLPEARAALTTALGADTQASDTDLVSAMQVLATQSDSTATFLVLAPLLDTPQRSAAVLTALGELAVDAYDFKRAQHLVAEALQRDPKFVDALRLTARIAVLNGDATLAISTAHEVTRVAGTDGAFELAEVLQDLGRTDEARKELERLRGAGGVDSQEVDRRLALLAFDSGDMQQAQKGFTALMRSGEPGDGVLFYLAQIAEAQGDKDAALAVYRRLIDSSMSAQARVAAAGLLLDAGKRAEAFALIDGMGDQDAHASIDLVVQKAHLLADHADADGGVALLAAALASFPHHPTLEYEYATMLERAGQTRQSIQTFEVMLAERPQDPTVLNALGYTLADHQQQLPRAEKLIRQALEGTPDSPAALDSLGWVRLRRGDSRDAAGILEHAYTVGQDPDIAAHWVEALWMSGSQAQARKVSMTPWRAIRIRRHSRRQDTAWCLAPDSIDMTARTAVAAGMRPLGLVWSLASLLALLGCQTAPKPLTSTATPEQILADWPARRAQLQARSHFTAQGRIGVVVGSDGFNGRLRWTQDGTRSTVSLDGPLGVGGVRIVQDAGVLTLTNPGGEVLDSQAAHDALVDRMGFEPPLNSLRYWLLGVPDPSSPSTEMAGAQGYLDSLTQSDWTVTISAYMKSADGALPRQLTVARANVRVKVVIDTWRSP